MKNKLTYLMGVAVIGLTFTAASVKADGFSFRISIGLPLPVPAVVLPPPPVVYAPPPAVVYAPPPVITVPPRVVCAPPPVVYYPPRTVYGVATYGYIAGHNSHKHGYPGGRPGRGYYHRR